MYRTALFVFALFGSPLALASTEQTTELDVSASFAEQNERIRADLADGETYSEISVEDRTKVHEALARISSALEDVADVEALSMQDKIEVHNDQELVNNILTQARADSRMVCKREKKVGSHRPVTACLTVADRRRGLEASQDALRNGQRTIQKLVN